MDWKGSHTLSIFIPIDEVIHISLKPEIEFLGVDLLRII